MFDILEIHRSYIEEAFLEAEKALSEDEVPIGAVVVMDNIIIGRGHNINQKKNSPVLHAEIEAISEACQNIKSKYLFEASIYVTLEPCLMCMGAILNAHISSLIFSAFDPKGGACGSVYTIPEKILKSKKLKIISGIFEEKQSKLLKAYFNNKRNN